MIRFKDAKIFRCSELEDYIKEIYGKTVDILERHAMNSGNDTFVEIDVNKEHPGDFWYPKDESLIEYPEKAIEEWLDEDSDYSEYELGIDESLILWDMCRKGIIPEGKYVMQACW